jgi:hypothetical protein
MEIAGLNFQGFLMLLQLWIDQIIALLKLLNWTVVFSGLTITEISRDIIPDRIESKWVRIIGIMVCVILSMSPAFNCGTNAQERLVTGLITGCICVGGYKFLFSFVGAIFGSLLGLATKLKNSTPVEPEIKK